MVANRIHPPFRRPEKETLDATPKSVEKHPEEAESEIAVISSETESAETNDGIDDEFRVGL